MVISLKKWIESIFNIQFIRFCIVGLSNTLLSYGLNVLILMLLASFDWKWDYVAGNIIAFVLSVLWSFYWNNRFVFHSEEREKRNIWKTLIRTYLAYGFTGILLNNLLSWIWISVIGISKYIAPLMNLVISVPLNFLINKFWAFRQEKTE